MESRRRSIAKAASYRILGSLATSLVSYAFTGVVGVSALIGAADFCAKLVCYYVHERVWSVIKL